jgi:hypothetical protein
MEAKREIVNADDATIFIENSGFFGMSLFS